MKLIRSALGVFVVLMAVSTVAAQTGRLEITVVDAAGPLPGATVTISHNAGYIAVTSILTDAKGTAIFPVLRAGQGYAVEVAFPGFGTRRVPNIRVQISQRERLTVQLAEEMTERVKVTAEGQVVDLEKTSTSSKFSDDFIQDLPVPGRFYQNVLTLAPGVQDSDGDGNPNVHGARERDFKAVVSGISNVDPLTGLFMSQVNPNSIEEMEVITAGAGAEFSRAQGGFARIIQKQGSNEFEGVAEFYYRSSLLDGAGAEDTDTTSDPDFQSLQPSFSVSGPIVKDKLWYRLSHEWIKTEIPINVLNGIAVQTIDQGVHSDQLTWQVSPRNKLALQFQSDPLTRDGLGVSSLVPYESSVVQNRTGETYSLTWTAPYSPKILIESQVAWQDLNTGFAPTTPDATNNCSGGTGGGFSFLETIQCFNVDTGQVSGASAEFHDDHSQRLTVRGDTTVYGGRFWGANHQFKFGASVENERYFRHLVRRPTGTIFLVQDDGSQNTSGTPETTMWIVANVSTPEEDDVTATGTNWGFYAEDQIKPAQNLTITVGLRVDREEINANGSAAFDPRAESSEYLGALDLGIAGTVAGQSIFTAYEGIDDFVTGLADTLDITKESVSSVLSNATKQSEFWHTTRRAGNINITNTNPAPRLALAWDPWSNGKTKFVVSAGRYYDKIFLDIPLIELEPVSTNIVFQSPVDQNGQFTSPSILGTINPSANVEVVDHNLQTPYQDEFTLQFEREIAAESVIKVTYLNRKFRNAYQDTDLNHAANDFGRCRLATPANNTTLVPSPGSGQTLVDPYTGQEYIDTDPGDGDGFIAAGLSGPFDDCAGELVTDPQDTGGDPTLDQTKRIEIADRNADLYIQNPGWGDVYEVGNFNSIDYTGFVLEFIRRQFRNWELQASYTWSKAIGDGEDFQQALGDDNSLREDERGFQGYDQRHVFKVSSTTITPWGFRAGFVVGYESGLPYSLLARSFSFDSVAPGYGSSGTGNPARVRQLYEDGQRNSQRNDGFWNVDLRFTKEMNLGRGLNMQISVELFNLLNDGTVRVFNQFNGNNAAVARFGRQWQLGMRMAF